MEEYRSMTVAELREFTTEHRLRSCSRHRMKDVLIVFLQENYQPTPAQPPPTLEPVRPTPAPRSTPALKPTPALQSIPPSKISSKLTKKVDQQEKKCQNLEKQLERNPRNKKVRNLLDQVRKQSGFKVLAPALRAKPQSSLSHALAFVPAAPVRPLAELIVPVAEG